MVAPEKHAVQPSDLSFHTIVKFFEAMSKAGKQDAKKYYLDNLLDKTLDRTSDDMFAVIRLILPFVSPSPAHQGHAERLLTLLEPSCLQRLIKATQRFLSPHVFLRQGLIDC